MLEIKNNLYIFTFFVLKADNSPFLHRDIPTIHNGYCVSNAVDYAKKSDVLPTILSWIRGSVIIYFSTEHNLTSIYRYVISFCLSIWRSAGLKVTANQKQITDFVKRLRKESNLYACASVLQGNARRQIHCIMLNESRIALTW